MWRKVVTVSLVLVLLLVAAASVLAITFGEPDGTDHPFVGAIVLRIPGEEAGEEDVLYEICSGTLIADDVFLTASHCTVPLDGYLARFPGSSVAVTFDPTISLGGTFYSGTWYTNPAYLNPEKGYSDSGDVGVIVLDEAPGITPAQLPAAGLLDDLKDAHTLKDTRFTAVGYGSVRDTLRTGFDAILDNVDRNRVEQGFNSLTKAWLNLPMLPTTGNGGTCYGDSGGPHFIHLDGVETTIVASITVSGDAPCKALDKTYRMDTESARSFLGDFVDLP